jgi:hypothetical protein
VIPGSVRAYHQPAGDLIIAQSLDNQGKHLSLAHGQVTA